jgi:hypothetical protein
MYVPKFVPDTHKKSYEERAENASGRVLLLTVNCAQVSVQYDTT